MVMNSLKNVPDSLRGVPDAPSGLPGARSGFPKRGKAAVFGNLLRRSTARGQEWQCGTGYLDNGRVFNLEEMGHMAGQCWKRTMARNPPVRRKGSGGEKSAEIVRNLLADGGKMW